MTKDIKNIPFLQSITLKPANHSDYKYLADFHYGSQQIGPLSHLFKLIDDHPQRRLNTPLVGFIAYGPPAANLAIRNIAIGGLFSGLPRAIGLSVLNRSCRCIRRVIIEPRYRQLGLATYLVQHTLHRVGTPMVEALSVMGRVHPFFEQAGMKSFPVPPDPKTERMTAALETIGLFRDQWHNSQAVHHIISTLPVSQKRFIFTEIEAFLQKFGSKRRLRHSFQRTEFLLTKLLLHPVYYLWTRPDSALQIPAPAIE